MSRDVEENIKKNLPEAVKEKMVPGMNRTGAPRRKVHRGGNGDNMSKCCANTNNEHST